MNKREHREQCEQTEHREHHEQNEHRIQIHTSTV